MNRPDRLPLPSPGRCWAFFLDIDGTLAPIAPTPCAVALPGHAHGVLARLVAATGGAVALISGRTIATIDRLFAPLSLAAAGLHGLERRGADGRVERSTPDPGAMAAMRARLEAFSRDHPGTLVEDKGAALALHFRGAPDAGAAAAALAGALVAGHDAGFVLQHGKMVVEIRMGGADKGSAVRAFMAEAPFRGCVPVFVGDDVTDEAGFAAVNDLGGVSIRVGPGDGTRARHVVGSVDAIYRWLEAAAAALSAPAQDSG